MSRGGKRPGAGRKASREGIDYAHLLKRKIQTYFNDEDVNTLIDLAYKQAIKGNSDVLKFLLDHIFGKARGNVGLDGGEEGKALLIQISEAIAKKRNLNDTDQVSK